MLIVSGLCRPGVIFLTEKKIMAEYLYKAEINHTEKTIQDLYKMQYYTYEKIRIIIRFLLGLALIIMAVSLSLPIWGRGALLLLGTWLAVSFDFPAQVRADKVIQYRKGSLPGFSYEFFNDKIKLSSSYNKSMDIPYKNLTILLHDKKYFYLVISKDSVCMIDKTTLEKSEKFMNFIENKTGLSWRTQNFLAF